MLKVENLCKNYPSFRLKNVSFSLEEGFIMGFIGINGAGKTTTLKSMLNLVKPDSGSVSILGKDITYNETEIKQDIGFMLGETSYYAKSKVKKIADIYKRFFANWDDELYKSLIAKFNIDERKKICELSTGMRVKLSVSFALSHNAKLLIFDEPTSGLDPIAREELLDLFRDIVADGDKSILFSTHITSDLDKCADYILFIREGEIVACSTKDDLIDDHLIIAGKKADFTDELKAKLIGTKHNAFGFTALIKKADYDPSLGLQAEKPNLEDIMIYYNKEEKDA